MKRDAKDGIKNDLSKTDARKEFEVSQSTIQAKNEDEQRVNDFIGVSITKTKTYSTLEDALEAPDSDFKPSSFDKMMNLIGFGAKNSNLGVTIVSKVKTDTKLFKLAEETFSGNKLLNKEANSLIEQMLKGNMNPGKGTKNIFQNVFELRSQNGARIYFRTVNDVIEILGYSNKQNQQEVIDRLKSLYEK